MSNPLSEYDLSTVHYLCSYYIDNANLDKEDIDYINELQSRVEKLFKKELRNSWRNIMKQEHNKWLQDLLQEY